MRPPHLLEPGQRGAKRQAEWQALFDAYAQDFPTEGEQLRQLLGVPPAPHDTPAETAPQPVPAPPTM